jgi:hypothetical protein
MSQVERVMKVPQLEMVAGGCTGLEACTYLSAAFYDPESLARFGGLITLEKLAGGFE